MPAPREFNGFGQKHEVDEIIDRVPVKGVALGMLAIFVVLILLIMLSSLTSYSAKEDIRLIISTEAGIQRGYKSHSLTFAAKAVDQSLVAAGDTLGYLRPFEVVKAVFRLRQLANGRLSYDHLPNQENIVSTYSNLHGIDERELLAAVSELDSKWRTVRNIDGELKELGFAIDTWERKYVVVAKIAGVFRCYACSPFDSLRARNALLFEVIPLNARILLSIQSNGCAFFKDLRVGESVSVHLPKDRDRLVKVSSVVVNSQKAEDACYLESTALYRQFFDRGINPLMYVDFDAQIELPSTRTSLLKKLLYGYEVLGHSQPVGNE